jgi:hypothetical protein
MPARRYRKRPVVVAAIGPLTADNLAEAADWVSGAGQRCDRGTDHLDIPTLEGTMRADLGDYVVRGVVGEFYPCKPDVFDQTYEPDL